MSVVGLLFSLLLKALASVIALGMQVTIAFVPSTMANGIATAFIGFAWGPVYPECSSMEIEVLDSDVRLSSCPLFHSKILIFTSRFI